MSINPTRILIFDFFSLSNIDLVNLNDCANSKLEKNLKQLTIESKTESISTKVQKQKNSNNDNNHYIYFTDRY